MIRMIFPIQPLPKLRARMTRAGHAYTPPQTRQYENTLRVMARVQAGGLAPLIGPISLRVKFILACPRRTKNVLPCVRPDLDNYLKAVKDAMNGILWKDDGQVVHLAGWKLYDKRAGGEPRIELEAESVE
jgi:Holliday junction resolvase RusA-like endonuclease